MFTISNVGCSRRAVIIKLYNNFDNNKGMATVVVYNVMFVPWLSSSLYYRVDNRGSYNRIPGVCIYIYIS